MKKIILMFVLVASAAHAEFKDGNKLYQQMTGNGGDYLNALGYITGVSDATRSTVHCIPENATAGQISDMVKLHMEQKPQLRHYPANIIVAYVLQQAWPCAKKGQSL